MADLAKNKTHLVLVNAVVENKGNILISQRSWKETHEPGKWTVPGGKVERTKGDRWNIIEQTLNKEILEETGIRIKSSVELLTNNTFIRSTGQHVISLIFLCHWKSGKAMPLEDTQNVAWIGRDKIGNYQFAPNVQIYLQMGFKRLQEKATLDPAN